jgi:hypothetical protein
MVEMRAASEDAVGWIGTGVKYPSGQWRMYNGNEGGVRDGKMTIDNGQ